MGDFSLPYETKYEETKLKTFVSNINSQRYQRFKSLSYRFYKT